MKKVLLIEDQEDLRQSISDMLNYENFEVFTAANGSQGIELTNEKRPDVILCDILMPDMDGYEVLKKLKQKFSFLSIPFIFLTALSEREHFRQGMELGADDYLTKPFTRKELIEAISSRLKKYSDLEGYISRKITEIERQVGDKLQMLQKEVDEKASSISLFSTKNELLGKQLKEKEIELIKETFSVIEVNNTLQDLTDMIKKELQNPVLSKDSKGVLIKLKNKTKKKTVLRNNLTIFQLKFNQTYPHFISNLTAHYTGLTQYEMVFISAHLMGLNTNQMADLLNITNDSVRKSRYRLKKKMGLNKEDDFLKFVHELNIGEDI